MVHYATYGVDPDAIMLFLVPHGAAMGFAVVLSSLADLKDKALSY